MPVAAARRLTKPSGLSRAVGAERVFDQRLALAPRRLVDHPFAFGLRLVGGDVGLRGRAHVELEPPTPPPADLAAPEIERADFRQPGVQLDRNRLGRRPSSAFAARCASAAAASSARGRSAPTRPACRSAACWKRTAETRPARKPADRTAARPARRRGPARFPPAADRRRAARGAGERGAAFGVGFDADVVRAGQSGGDPHALAAPHHAVVGRPAGHGQIEPVVVEHDRLPRRVSRPLAAAMRSLETNSPALPAAARAAAAIRTRRR